MGDPEEPGREPRIEDFLGDPTRDLEAWRWLWEGDHTFPIHSHRGLLGRLIVVLKRALRPFVKAPVVDLWERQRSYNRVVLRRLVELGELGRLPGEIQTVHDELLRDLRQVRTDLVRDVKQHAGRLAHLEEFKREGLGDVMRHTDALFARVDQRFDRYRRESRDLWSRLGALLARVEGEAGEAARLAGPAGEQAYQELEERFRGTERDIASRIERYREVLPSRGRVLDLGCGRGEALEVLAGLGLEARGVDGSAEMVRCCREKGLTAVHQDLFEALAAVAEGGLSAVVSFHVIEHLPPGSLDRLTRLSWRALAQGGVLILETPNPLSLLVAARNFWKDPTHLRPVHPETLRLLCEQAGFDRVERLDLRPFPEGERLPEIDVAALSGEQRELGHQINALRDRIDGLLFGHQDYAIVAGKG